MAYEVIKIDLPISVKALTTKMSDGSYVIVLNTKHSREQQRYSFIHELKHIISNDLENCLLKERLPIDSVELKARII